VGGMYSVVGFIDVNRKRLGEKLAGVEILGSIDNIGKVIREHKISEVIFSTDSLSYMEILSVIGRSRDRAVNFRLVPSSLEVIIGKTSIDQLEDVPLVNIDYNIDKPAHRVQKQIFDSTVAALMLITLYPLTLLAQALGLPRRGLAAHIRLLPTVIIGKLSLVGRPYSGPPGIHTTAGNSSNSASYLGKEGLTGLAQINYREGMTEEEVDKYNLYYAKNQSFVLDIEILFKAFVMMFRTKAR
jgi:hypothetical protein